MNYKWLILLHKIGEADKKYHTGKILLATGNRVMDSFRVQQSASFLEGGGEESYTYPTFVKGGRIPKTFQLSHLV